MFADRSNDHLLLTLHSREAYAARKTVLAKDCSDLLRAEECDFECRDTLLSLILHKVVEKIGLPVLITRLMQGIIGMYIIIHMIAPIRQLLPLLPHSVLFLLLSRAVSIGHRPVTITKYTCTHSLLPDLLLPLSQLPLPILLLLPQIRILFQLGLVQPIDDDVFALLDVGALDLLVIVKGHLPHGHAAIFAQVGPGRVYDRDVVLFVACCRVLASVRMILVC